MDLNLHGKNVLVTGGTRGIGRAVVLGFARQGANVWTCYRTERPEVDSLRQELAAVGGDHHVEQADVGDPVQARELVARAVKALGGLDVIVHNAGVVSHATLADLEPSEWDRVLDVNLRAPYEITRAALPHLQAGASVISVASAVAAVGMAGRTHYTASKAAMIGFNRSLSRELGPKGVRVNAVAPGIIDTDQTSGLTPKVRARYENLAALGRLGTGQDVANTVLFLASDLAGFVAGQTLVVDGGI
jgi:3-oxoacyl-[acyl-carrier protein] reductase